MGITVATMRAAIPTGTGTQDFTTADCGGLTPKAALLFMTRATADESVTSDGSMCIGVVVSATKRWSVCTAAQDTQATTVTGRGGRSARCLSMLNVTGTAVEGTADFSAWITNGITINFDDAFPSGYLLTTVFFCGSDLSVDCGGQDMGNTENLERDINTLGFQPNLVFGATVGTATLDSVTTTPRLCFGVAHESGGVVTQRSIAQLNSTGQAVVTMSGRLSTQYGIFEVGTSGVASRGFEFANFDSDGFSLIARELGGNNIDVGWFALNFGGAASSWVGTVASPTATGSAAITAPGFKPQFVMRGLGMFDAVDTSYISDLANAFGVGVITANAQFCNSMWDDDGAADSNSKCISDNIPVNIQNGVDGTGLAASFTSFDATGWTVNYTDVEAAAKQSWAVAIQESVEGGLAQPIFGQEIHSVVFGGQVVH